MTPLELAFNFFSSLFSDPPAAASVNFWAPGLSEFHPACDHTILARRALDLGQSRDLYVGIGLRDAACLSTRGRSQDVIAITAAWADIDLTKSNSKKLYFRTRDELLRFLRGLPIPPTLIIWTGGGAHVYWLLHEPWRFADDADHQDAARLLAQWQAFLRQRAAAFGATLDATHDLARVLRIPGTVNTKYGCIVTLDPHVGRHVDPSELRDLCGHLSVATDVAFDATLGVALDVAATPPALAFATLCRRDRCFARIWRRETRVGDGSQSAFDFALAVRALTAGWDDGAVVALLIAHRRNGGAPLKLRHDYYARTLARARAARPEPRVVKVNAL